MKLFVRAILYLFECLFWIIFQVAIWYCFVVLKNYILKVQLPDEPSPKAYILFFAMMVVLVGQTLILIFLKSRFGINSQKWWLFIKWWFVLHVLVVCAALKSGYLGFFDANYMGSYATLFSMPIIFLGELEVMDYLKKVIKGWCKRR